MALKGHKLTPEQRAKLSLAMKGRKQTPEHTEKIAAANRESYRIRLATIGPRISPFRGVRASAEAVRKNSECHKGIMAGEKHPMFGKKHTPESIAKMSKSHSGRKQSLEQIQKKVDSRKGYSHSEETKQRIRETNIKTWSREEVRFQSIGENNATWFGGKTKERYPVGWSPYYKETIRDRDNHTCQVCGIKEEDCGVKHNVHHIDYDKNNLSPSNLISLCGKCHGITNFNRDQWTIGFTIKIQGAAMSQTI
jgi:hypothetical protein